MSDRTWPCCEHCAEDQPHIPEDTHDLPCHRCQEVSTESLERRIEAQDTEIRRLLAQVEEAQDLAEIMGPGVTGPELRERLGLPRKTTAEHDAEVAEMVASALAHNAAVRAVTDAARAHASTPIGGRWKADAALHAAVAALDTLERPE